MTASVKIRTIGLRTTDRKRKFGLAAKGRAFLSRKSGFGPLVDVAREGLAGGYELSEHQQLKYASRLIESYGGQQVCGLLGAGIPEPAQVELSAGIAEHFLSGLKDLQCLGRAIGDREADSGTWQENGAPMIRDLLALRNTVAGVLLSEKVDSTSAQGLLTTLFDHHKVLYARPLKDSGLPKQIKSILESGHIRQPVKETIIDSVLASGCSRCKKTIGLPLEPEDRDYHQ
ncbi:hypothetical protein GF318_04835 [Candidatus Micrarchaeota archaeon]|nr:hypothetical protein [Candidatus Micrarchaeota archaeon]